MSDKLLVNRGFRVGFSCRGRSPPPLYGAYGMSNPNFLPDALQILRGYGVSFFKILGQPLHLNKENE